MFYVAQQSQHSKHSYHCAVSANAATSPSGVSAADPLTLAVLHLAEAANAPSSFCARGPSTGAASSDTAALPPGFSAANLPHRHCLCLSKGSGYPTRSWCYRPFNRYCLGPNECNRRSHRCQRCNPGIQCCPSSDCPSYQHCSLVTTLQCRWLHSGDIWRYHA